jgi:MATE family multidrug resistance protein
VGYWVVGLPVAYVLAFPWGWGAAGIWVGLSAALILIGLILVPAWQRRVGKAIAFPGQQ